MNIKNTNNGYAHNNQDLTILNDLLYVIKNILKDEFVALISQNQNKIELEFLSGEKFEIDINKII